MNGIILNGKWYENAGLACRTCEGPVYHTEKGGYFCPRCGKKVPRSKMKKLASNQPPIRIMRPIEGHSLDEELEFVMDGNGKPKVFWNREAAEKYLLESGYSQKDLERVFFQEVAG